jgi:AraC family transcriptional regulator
MPRLKSIPGRVGADRISMRVFHTPEGAPLRPATPCDEWAAVEMNEAENAPAGMQTYALPGGLYAVFVHRGPASTFPQTASAIYGRWLPASDYELDHRPHLAVMGPDYRLDDPGATEEIWVPITTRPGAGSPTPGRSRDGSES